MVYYTTEYFFLYIPYFQGLEHRIFSPYLTPIGVHNPDRFFCLRLTPPPPTHTCIYVHINVADLLPPANIGDWNCLWGNMVNLLK